MATSMGLDLPASGHSAGTDKIQNTRDLTTQPAMAPSTVDLLVLTFNCAKNLVNVGVFANHVHTAFTNNAAGLPDIVVLSLQEVAPLSPSFIGDYFLQPYFSRFDEAINLAARRHIHGAQADEAESVVSITPTTSESDLPPKPERTFTLIKAHNVGYTAIMLFARDPQRIRRLQDAEVGFGAAEMGNKGAVGLRTLYDVEGDGRQATELTFVATHLAAMEWNLPRRNANWAAIMRGMTFGDPETILDGFKGPEGTPPPAQSGESGGGGEGDGETHRLLHDTHDEEHLQVQRGLHGISVFKPSSHLFVAGDLNYRISTSSPPPNAAFPSLDPSSENYYPTFLPLDQLTRERAAGRTMHGLSEEDIKFPPTYKYNVLPKDSPVSDEDEADVPWKFASHRYPSWTDRVLYLDLPSWVKSKSENDSPRMNVLAYDALPLARSSDHRAVYLRIQVPLIPPEDMAPSESTRGVSSDPRARLPVEVDPEAWERRRAARRKELVTGWSAFLWSTKEGAWILATLLAVGMGTWWMYKAR
ncbi:hypothetical protein QQS21_012094 [Conoideocrella luteorostrata]|uniref:Inositol polyphosphate-related phosphatase domain-containing protein n=1 Tax=Conoideocrella luteorostrata TaxID=1105319 RepID=A0AAJ0FMZ3_9HYPO|nr:hypothetical protein QQS21_012094 [Conoideocrella luteorostrata]